MANGYLLGNDQPDQVDEHDIWVRVTSSLPDLRITAFEAKALYAFALMRQLAESSARLHDSSLHLPSLVLIADAIEALGRCLSGCQKETRGSTARLRSGLEQLERRRAFTTMFGLYEVAEVMGMRNFTTHGGTTPNVDPTPKLDAHLSVLLLGLFGNELTAYWDRLKQVGNPERDMLAQARIRPLYTNGDPIFVRDMFTMMSMPEAQAGQGYQGPSLSYARELL